MTDQERANIMSRLAEQFVLEADRSCQGMTNEQMTCTMLGTIGGAITIMLASGIPHENVSTSINSMLADMKL